MKSIQFSFHTYTLHDSSEISCTYVNFVACSSLSAPVLRAHCLRKCLKNCDHDIWNHMLRQETFLKVHQHADIYQSYWLVRVRHNDKLFGHHCLQATFSTVLDCLHANTNKILMHMYMHSGFVHALEFVWKRVWVSVKRTRKDKLARQPINSLHGGRMDSTNTCSCSSKRWMDTTGHASNRLTDLSKFIRGEPD